MSEEINKIKCPDVEFVSAYFDGELDSASTEFSHIKECPECQKRLQSYQNIADILKKELSSAVPKDLSNRVISGIKRRNHLNRQSNFSFPVFLKIAAMFIIIGLALILILPEEQSVTKLNEKTDVTPEFLDLKEKPNTHMTTMDFPGRNQVANNNGAIDWKHFFPASTSRNKKINFVEENAKEKPAIISPVVKQVWVVKDLNAGMKKFAKFAKNNHLKLTKDRHKNIKVSLSISKIHLIELVRKCHQAGFKLLSPAQPQPEQNTFTGNKNDMVEYHATFTSLPSI
jgi:anti sigma-E protein RseA